MEARKVKPISSQICIVVASNDNESLQRNLLASDIVQKSRVPVHVERGAESATVAYNNGLDTTEAPYVIFAHQDVYFPPQWESQLAHAITSVSQEDPNWALIAPFGVSKEGEHVGRVWSTSQTSIVGKKPDGSVHAQSFDELAIILRRESGLRFDEALPCFHLYGTDIVLTAWSQGLGAYVRDLPLVHNDDFHDKLRDDFTRSYDYLRKKWKTRLPIRSPVVKIDAWGLSLAIYRLRAQASIEKRRALAGDTSVDPRHYSSICGWE